MSPAYSIIFFTVFSGAGYGLLAIVSLTTLTSLLPDSTMLNLIMLILSLLLISVGLLFSTAQLGHPERAWRAVSQWKTSWLSREGLLALITYVPALLLCVIWTAMVIQSFSAQSINELENYVALIGGVCGLCAILTVFCTGQIYASLKTIPAWNYFLTTPIFCLLSIVSGLLLWIFFNSVFSYKVSNFVVLFSVFMLEAAFLLKWVYWNFVDKVKFSVTKAEAIGLEKNTSVQNLEPAHQTQNYLMREMGYNVARKHALKLRWFASWAAFIIPGICLLVGVIDSSYMPITSFIASLCLIVGLITERWLFFAEAKHVITLYY